jgi:SAM-dependent methyltransferase
VQKYSTFHAEEEAVLNEWHQPYVDVFRGRGPVLDIGCGLGLFADVLRDSGIASVGIDFDPDMVKASTDRGHTAILGNETFLETMKERFVGIHISHVIEHLWGEDAVRLLERCWLVLDETGVLVIRTPNWERAAVRRRVFWMDHTHRRPYSVNLLNKILTDIGFTILAAGHEPYGHKDVFVVAAKQPREGDLHVRPKFRRSPFRKQRFYWRIARAAKHMLRQAVQRWRQ